MKKTFGKQAMRIMAAVLVMVLLMVPMASGEQSAWDCPECGRAGNLWNYCGNCAHPAPWIKEEGFDEEKAYDAVLKRLEEIDGSIDALNGKLAVEVITSKVHVSSAKGTISGLSARKTGNIVVLSFVLTLSENVSIDTSLGCTATFDDNSLKPAFRQPGSTSIRQVSAVNIDVTSSGANLNASVNSNLSAGNAMWLTFIYICNG